MDRLIVILLTFLIVFGNNWLDLEVVAIPALGMMMAS
jgi:hypothetical protein